jgi:putative tryptophan/tyrosine transport system substrate-binding protein
MKRREFIKLASGATVAWPFAAHAQQNDKIRTIAVLMGIAATPQSETYLAAFSQRIEALGWTRDRNTRIQVRWWTGTPEQMRTTAADLLALSPDVIVAFSNLAVALLQPMEKRVPIVFAQVGDPIGSGFVASLAHPGGNITGFAGYDGAMGGKWLEVLKETVPNLTRVMTIFHPETPVHQGLWRSIQGSAAYFGIEAIPGGIHDADEIKNAISQFATREDGNGGIIILPHAIINANDGLLVALAQQHRLPALFSSAGSVRAGGLVSYGYDLPEAFGKTAEYVDRILRGEKPGDLPVQQPIKFNLVFNLKTAKAIGLTIPPAMLSRADEVIE